MLNDPYPLLRAEYRDPPYFQQGDHFLYFQCIESIKSDPPAGNKVDLYILLAVTDRDHLAKILRRLRRKDFVISATRIHSWEQRNATLPIIEEELSEDN